MSDLIDRWKAWVRTVGAPLVVPCDIDVTSSGAYTYICHAHNFRFDSEERAASGRERCPVSRLEEWRARRWEAAA